MTLASKQARPLLMIHANLIDIAPYCSYTVFLQPSHASV